MRPLNFRKLLAFALCTISLITISAARPANAGILAFLGRHLLGSSKHHQKHTARHVYHHQKRRTVARRAPATHTARPVIGTKSQAKQQTAARKKSVASTRAKTDSLPTVYHPLKYDQPKYHPLNFAMRPYTPQSTLMLTGSHSRQRSSVTKALPAEVKNPAPVAIDLAAKPVKSKLKNSSHKGNSPTPVAQLRTTYSTSQVKSRNRHNSRVHLRVAATRHRPWRTAAANIRARRQPETNPAFKSAPIFDDRQATAPDTPILSRARSESDTAGRAFKEPELPSNEQAFSTRASWYGPGFQGRRTASGARFNQYGLTAASRTLPLGSKVLVANPATGRCCTVTINDRGPYVAGRDIDLSRGAANRVGITGVSPVICVAYAEAGSGSAAGHRSKKGRRSRASASPPKIKQRVMHLIAGVM